HIEFTQERDEHRSHREAEGGTHHQEGPQWIASLARPWIADEHAGHRVKHPERARDRCYRDRRGRMRPAEDYPEPADADRQKEPEAGPLLLEPPADQDQVNRNQRADEQEENRSQTLPNRQPRVLLAERNVQTQRRRES